jgi:hypothetical protein
MIKFFRKIRQNLLSESKFSKYLVYAIGEILLVVIGILIALQINNWNTNKNNRIFELKMLNEISVALKQDYIFFNDHLLQYRNKTEIDAIAFFDRAILSNRIVVDSLDYHFNRLDFGLRVTYNRGPYDALSASGIDKITNDSLRNKLIYFYDFVLPRNSGLIEFNKEFNRAKMDPLMQKVSVTAPIMIDDDKIIRSGRSIKGLDFAKNQDFNELLYLATNKSQTIRGLLESITPKMLELNELLNNEIKK